MKCQGTKRFFIQIHLMLLFNSNALAYKLCTNRFKYISCYYLTREKDRDKNWEVIQIHLMLLFNDKGGETFVHKMDSNTSHVII